MNTTSHIGNDDDGAEYPPLVARLAHMGYIHMGKHWFDYRTLGITDHHADALARLATDSRHGIGREHAWRALGQLRAVRAVPALLDALDAAKRDILTLEDIPAALTLIGAPAVPIITERIRARTSTDTAMLFMLDALESITHSHPKCRAECIGAMRHVLDNMETYDDTIVGAVADMLTRMQAREHAVAIAHAYEEGCVDWDDQDIADFRDAMDYKEPMEQKSASEVYEAKEGQRRHAIISEWHDIFAASSHFTALTPHEKEEAFHVETAVADGMLNYHGQEPSEWKQAEFADVCTNILPGKVACGPEFFDAVAPVMRAFLACAEEHGWIMFAGQLRRRLERIADQIVANGKNPECWHMAKSFVMEGSAAGFNMSTDEGVKKHTEARNKQASSLDPHQPIVKMPTPGRNDPCPCGSGKKYKKCCGGTNNNR